MHAWPCQRGPVRLPPVGWGAAMRPGRDAGSRLCGLARHTAQAPAAQERGPDGRTALLGSSAGSLNDVLRMPCFGLRLSIAGSSPCSRACPAHKHEHQPQAAAPQMAPPEGGPFFGVCSVLQETFRQYRTPEAPAKDPGLASGAGPRLTTGGQRAPGC